MNGSYQDILSAFQKNHSVQITAEETNSSKIKVQRVLITEGLWSSKTSRKIGELYSQGLSAPEIAEWLHQGVKSVQAYLPYTRGAYGGNERTKNAEWTEAYRERQKNAQERQVYRAQDRDNRKAARMEMKDIGTFDKAAPFVGAGHKIMKLHLELVADFSDEEEATMKKYGKMDRAISRDILVSSEMPLHALHYAIQRAFGWQNSHLHHFAYDEDVFGQLTQDKFTQWCNLCGLYFRFPDEEMDDLYWDDDYEEGQGFRTWLRQKYTAPYLYDGRAEHYLNAQAQAKILVQEHPVINVGPSFQEFMEGKKEQKEVRIEQATMEEMQRSFEGGLDELLERLTIGEVLALEQTSESMKKVEELIQTSQGAFRDHYMELRKIEDTLDEIEQIEEKADRLTKQKKPSHTVPFEALQERQQKKYEAEQRYLTLMTESNPTMVPLSDTLIYAYDYGDGWEVEITCKEVYESFDSDNQPSTTGYALISTTEQQVFEDQKPVDRKGNPIQGELRDQIATVVAKGRPVCIAADGLPVMDDVGGVYGYCEFLNTIHQAEPDEREENKNWARNMGWNGRMHKVENIL